MRLLEITAHGANAGVKLKRDAVVPKPLAKEVAAFANMQILSGR